MKIRIILIVLLFPLVLVGCIPDLSTPGKATLWVELTPPKGVEALDLDSTWIVVRNVKSGLSDSALSLVCQPLEFNLPVGNYHLSARGSKKAGRTILQWQGVALSYALYPEGNRLEFPLEQSVVQNPDYRPEEQQAVLSVEVSPPPSVALLSMEGLEVRVQPAENGEAKSMRLGVGGRAQILLASGVYRVEVYGRIALPGGGMGALYGALEGVEMPASGSIDCRVALRRIADGPVGEGEVAITLVWDNAHQGSMRAGQKVHLRHLITGASVEAMTDSMGVARVRLPFGIYRVEVEVYSLDGSGLWLQTFSAKSLEVQHIEDGTSASIPLTLSGSSSGLVFKEIYFTCSRSTATGEPYDTDRYVELYNNTPYTLYADGVAFCATYANTMLMPQRNFFPEYLGSSKVVAGFIFSIPGNGHEHPVPPGGTVLIADQGLNHHAINPGCPVDLSKADFEWYDYHWGDVDVPEVPNLQKWYSYSPTVTVLHNRGYWGFFIVKPEGDMASFLESQAATGVFPNGRSAHFYAIDQAYILDAVQCAAPSGPLSQVFSPSVDAGYTYCDGAFIAKSVRRRVVRRDGNRYILMDTNNSTYDFIPNAEPSPRVVKE